MHWFAAILLLLLVGLQYRLWVGDGSLAETRALQEEVDTQRTEIEQLRARSSRASKPPSWRSRTSASRTWLRARNELGMIKEGELFLQILEEPADGSPPGAGFSRWGP